jgi:hypothetical protein
MIRKSGYRFSDQIIRNWKGVDPGLQFRHFGLNSVAVHTETPGNCMRPKTAILLTALTLAAMALGGCAQRGQTPVSSLGEDDDAICRGSGVKVGSAEYVACRKDRDAVRSNAIARSDRAQRDLGEYMLNHPAQ